LAFEEDHGVDGGPAALSVPRPSPLPHEAQVQLRLEMPVEVVGGNEVLERDGDWLIEPAGFRRAEHDGLRDGRMTRRVVQSIPTAKRASPASFSTRAHDPLGH
jgi:hypothetical protein